MLDKIKNKHLLVDGDIYAYRCAASAEKTKYLVETRHEDCSPALDIDYTEFQTHAEAKKLADEKSGIIWSRKEVQPLEFALQACKTALDALLAKLNPQKISVFLTPDRTFRHDIARTKPYKGNRDQPKPKYLKEVKEYLVKHYGATFGVNVEADDEIGVALSRDPDGAVSISIDKDLLQIPGWHYNWVNDTVQRVSPRDGDFNFYTQMLTGDATDNVPGLPGTGPAGASKILLGAKSCAELCSRVWMCYRGEFNDAQKARDYFFEQAKLLWILRYNPALSHGDRIWTQGFIPPIELK
jgi:5'-3' exonuclease